MTPEEVDRNIEFILQMQAQFEANMGEIRTNLKLCETNIDKLRDSQATLTPALVRLTEIIEENERRSEERRRKTDERFAELAGAQKATNERLNVLINVVEEQRVRRRNGRKRLK